MPSTLTCADPHCPDGPRAHIHTLEGGVITGPAFPPPEAEQRGLSEDAIERLAQVAYLAVCGGKDSSFRDWGHLDPTTQVYYRDLARAVARATLDDLAKQVAGAVAGQASASTMRAPGEAYDVPKSAICGFIGVGGAVCIAEKGKGLLRCEKHRFLPDNPWEQVRTRPPRLLEEIRALKAGLDIVEQGCDALLELHARNPTPGDRVFLDELAFNAIAWSQGMVSDRYSPPTQRLLDSVRSLQRYRARVAEPKQDD